MQSTAVAAGSPAGATRPLDEDVLLLTMQRVYMVAALQGGSGIERNRLLDLARRPGRPDCAGLAVEALEAGGHLVALDRKYVRAGRVFRRDDAVWLPQWLPRRRFRTL